MIFLSYCPLKILTQYLLFLVHIHHTHIIPYLQHCVHIHPDPHQPDPHLTPPPDPPDFFFVNYLKNFNSSFTPTLIPQPEHRPDLPPPNFFSQTLQFFVHIHPDPPRPDTPPPFILEFSQKLHFSVHIYPDPLTRPPRPDPPPPIFYAPNFEKVGDISVSACPYVCI